MAENFKKAAIRHYTDAEHLAKQGRLDNAGHLIGFAAECAIKYACHMITTEDTIHKHLPQIALIALKKIKGRDTRQHPLRNLLEQSRANYFHDWTVSSRYDDDTTNISTYTHWKHLAKRTLNAASIALTQ